MNMMPALKKIPNFSKLPNCITSKMSLNARFTIILCNAKKEKLPEMDNQINDPSINPGHSMF